MKPSTARTVVPVRELTEPWLGYEPKAMTDESLARKLLCCAPGSPEHAALLRERERRRTVRARAFAATEPGR